MPYGSIIVVLENEALPKQNLAKSSYPEDKEHKAYSKKIHTY